LKTLSQQHDIETYIDDFVFIYEDVDECTSSLVQITWYKYLIKFIRHRLVGVVGQWGSPTFSEKTVGQRPT
jgi:hypothetical protein